MNAGIAGTIGAAAYVGNAGKVALTGATAPFSSSEFVNPVWVSSSLSFRVFFVVVVPPTEPKFVVSGYSQFSAGSKFVASLLQNVPRMVYKLDVMEDAFKLGTIPGASVQDTVLFRLMPIYDTFNLCWEVIVPSTVYLDPVVVFGDYVCVYKTSHCVSMGGRATNVFCFFAPLIAVSGVSVIFVRLVGQTTRGNRVGSVVQGTVILLWFYVSEAIANITAPARQALAGVLRCPIHVNPITEKLAVCDVAYHVIVTNATTR
ncbi:hypothetical protein EDB85DRAFT_1895672 [Lactarius pseudohatsudake]|nr:hypothetical protein EDB85DRAFT_1895672 [Lactarius pseudohatsudake]